ncbi:MAG TPA: hypothetical protein VEY50_03025 [Lysobacter sp.]|nr:hypothetical protein [Lysobacter sp.]
MNVLTVRGGYAGIACATRLAGRAWPGRAESQAASRSTVVRRSSSTSRSFARMEPGLRHRIVLTRVAALGDVTVVTDNTVCLSMENRWVRSR